MDELELLTFQSSLTDLLTHTRMTVDALISQGPTAAAAALESAGWRLERLRQQPQAPRLVLAARQSTGGSGDGRGGGGVFASSGSFGRDAAGASGRRQSSYTGNGKAGTPHTASGGAPGGGDYSTSYSSSMASSALLSGSHSNGSGSAASQLSSEAALGLFSRKGGGLDHAPLALPFPSRVAVVAGCEAAAEAVAAALRDSPHTAVKPAVAFAPSLEAAEKIDAPVLVVCPSEGVDPALLARLAWSPLGRMRGIVVVAPPGGLDPKAQDAIFIQMHGFCDLVRCCSSLPLGPRCASAPRPKPRLPLTLEPPPACAPRRSAAPWCRPSSSGGWRPSSSVPASTAARTPCRAPRMRRSGACAPRACPALCPVRASGRGAPGPPFVSPARCTARSLLHLLQSAHAFCEPRSTSYRLFISSPKGRHSLSQSTTIYVFILLPAAVPSNHS